MSRSISGKSTSAVTKIRAASTVALSALIAGLTVSLPTIGRAANDGSQLIIARQVEQSVQTYPGDAIRASAPALGSTGSPDTPKLDQVDLAALYYYARERQTVRVEAEILRLQIIYPGFVPPADLYMPESERAPDETALWKLYEVNDFAAIDAEIVRRKSDDPNWQPSDDFTSKLEQKTRRILIKSAAEAKDWVGVMAAAKAVDPATETDFDLVWTMADALVEMGDKAGAANALHALIERTGENRLSDDQLVVTLQKSLAVSSAAEVRKTMAQLWPDSSNLAVKATLELDLARAEVGNFNANEEALPVSQEQLLLLGGHAVSANSPADMALLGWYSLKTKEPEKAEPLFMNTLRVEANPDNAKGAYLSLARQDKDEEAYEFAAAHLKDLRDDPVFLMNVLSPRFGGADDEPVGEASITAYSDAIMHTRSGDHAEILAWYAYNSRQYEAAEAWFRQAYDWEAKEDRIKGLALTFLRLGKKKSYKALSAEFADYYPDIWSEIAAAPEPKKRRAASVSTPSTSTSASYVRHFEAKNYAACLSAIDKLGSAARQPKVQLIAGWCHLGQGRIGEARNAFEFAMSGGGRISSDAVYGNALTLLRARLTDEAESLIAAYPVSTVRDRELRAEIYYQRARSAFDHKQYQRVIRALDARAALVAEPRDLTQLRGWAFYHLGQEKRAQAVFAQLDMHIRESGVTSFLNTAESIR